MDPKEVVREWTPWITVDAASSCLCRLCYDTLYRFGRLWVQKPAPPRGRVGVAACRACGTLVSDM